MSHLAPESAKELTEEKIIKKLSEAHIPVSWSELRKKVNVSRNTLADRLVELEKKGQVVRNVDVTKRPPRVTYTTTEKALSDPFLKIFNQLRQESEKEIASRWMTALTQKEMDASKYLDLFWDEIAYRLVYALKYALKYKKHSRLLLNLNIDDYAMNLLGFIVPLLKNKEKADNFAIEIEKEIIKFTEEGMKEAEKALSPYVSQFEERNKAVAFTTLGVYILELRYNRAKSNFASYLRWLYNNETSQKAHGIGLKDIESLLADPATQKIDFSKIINPLSVE